MRYNTSKVANGTIRQIRTSMHAAVTKRYAPRIKNFLKWASFEKMRLAPAIKMNRGAARDEIILKKTLTSEEKK
jgi:hypothetical protein